VATDVNVEALESLHEEAPDIRPEVMDVTKYEDVETIIPGVRPRLPSHAVQKEFALGQVLVRTTACDTATRQVFVRGGLNGRLIHRCKRTVHEPQHLSCITKPKFHQVTGCAKAQGANSKAAVKLIIT